MSDVRERPADYADWAGWMHYLLRKCDAHPDGSVTIPAAFVDRWRRQMKAVCGEASDLEKEADRAETDQMLAIFKTTENAPLRAQLAAWRTIVEAADAYDRAKFAYDSCELSTPAGVNMVNTLLETHGKLRQAVHEWREAAEKAADKPKTQPEPPNAQQEAS